MNKSDIIEALNEVIECFDKLTIAYYIGGSIASSAYGMARATVDVDLVARIEMSQVDRLVRSLEANYYISAEMIEDAIQRRVSFDLVHLETMIKIDVFVAKKQPYDSEAFARRRPDTLDEESSRKFDLASPEDVVLGKLQRYQNNNGKMSWMY